MRVLLLVALELDIAVVFVAVSLTEYVINCDKLWDQGIPRWCRCVNVLRIGAIREQLKQIPHDASHVVVSVGGNNATGASTTVLGGPVTDCEEAKMRGAYRDCRWPKETWWNQLNMIPNDIGDDDDDDDDDT